jgi:hypothetical protein
MKNLKHIFGTNKEATELHSTSDDQVFFQKHHAESHAATLKDKTVTTTTREEADAFKLEKEVKTETPEKKLTPAQQKAADKKAADDAKAAEEAAAEEAKKAEEAAAATK